jgi:hypothetical protein
VTDKTASAKREEYQALYEKFVPPFLNKLVSVQDSLNGEQAADRRTRAALQQVREEYMQFRSQRPRLTCEKPNFPWVPSAIASNIQLRSENEEGSGFYFKLGDRRYLATAAHVSEPDLHLKTQLLINKIIGGVQSGTARFDFIPGLIWLTADISMASEKPDGPALELIDSEQIPEVGQRFFVAGFPS